MAVSYYTSYETSVALKAAGAPQEIPAGGGYWRDFGDVQHRYVTSVDREAVEDVIRSMRLDEILEALEPHGLVILRRYGGGGEGYGCVVGCREPWPTEYLDATPVEAAAACWLAVMRAGSEARK